MNWVISGTWGPTDPTRAMLPFLFAASAVQAGDNVMLMLFHDAVLMAVDGIGKTLVPVGPPNRYEEIAGNPKVTLWACKPCVGAWLDRMKALPRWAHPYDLMPGYPLPA
jgi:predicted peroxiredoxin